MSYSTELHRIVGAVRNERMEYKREIAIVTLANHADALVALVEACEVVERDWPGSCGPSLGAMKRALAAVHAVHAVKP